jgi:hypothetical protein
LSPIIWEIRIDLTDFASMTVLSGSILKASFVIETGLRPLGNFALPIYE